MSNINIAIDVMGGDFAPLEILKGVKYYLQRYDSEKLYLVGKKDKVEDILKTFDLDNNFFKFIEIVNANDNVDMEDSPTTVIKKKDASINIAMQLLKEGVVSALISAGNTGAIMTSGIKVLGTIKGIKRPAIITVWPTKANKPAMLLDSGANSDTKPGYLLQFAFMGDFYAKHVMKIKNPTIGLLNIGTESHKGTNLLIETYKLLKKTNLNFVGNIEPADFISGNIDVAIADGFTGNLFLKTGEAISEFIVHVLKTEYKSNLFNKILGLLSKNIFFKLKKQLDSSEYGGALLLGLDGIVLKSHGKADAKTIYNSISSAKRLVSSNLISIIKEFANKENQQSVSELKLA